MNATLPQARLGAGLNGREVLVRYAFLLVMAAFVAFFGISCRAFLSPANLANILEGSTILLLVALGMTLVVATGGIDLSVGVAVDFGSAFAIVAMKSYDLPWGLALVTGLCGGALVGLLTAFLVVRLAVSPFLATLGVFFIGGSVQRIFTHGGGPISFRQLPSAYYAIGIGDLGGVPLKVLIGAALLAGYYLALERSLFGKRIHAIGLQQSAARVAGIRVGAYLALGFTVASATCAIGGIIASANLRMFTPLAGHSYLMHAIAAVFIGASIHSRGRPNVLGTLVGVLFLGVVANGLNLMGLDFNVKDALSGVILVGALALAVAQKHLRR
jgi:ribose transport system permease protein